MIPWGIPVGDLLLKSIAIKLRDITSAHGSNLPAWVAMNLRSCKCPAPSPASSTRIGGGGSSRSLRSQSTIDGHDVTVGGSIGIAFAPPGDIDTEIILKSADLAMYSAKSDGRGTYRMFDPEMDAIVQARRILERDLRTAFVARRI